MERSLDAGIDILNDIDGFDSPEKLSIIEQFKPSVLAMNNGRLPVKYSQDVTIELPHFFEEKIAELQALGLNKNQIAIDAGVGFFNGPSGKDSIKRVKTTEQLTKFGNAVMIAISHKSFMPNLFDIQKEETLFSTLMFEQSMLEAGGRILRVHDTLETKRLIENWKKYKRY
jgi:dihydropteroate synthase